MAEAVDLLAAGVAIPHVPSRGVALAVAICLCAPILWPLRTQAADTDPPTHPIWTLVPTHIDPAKENHIRIAPQDTTADRVVMSVDRPIRISPEGTFSVDGKPTQIFGLVVTDRQTLCETPAGARWACGLRSQAAFISLLATRALTCERLSPLGASVTLVTCKAGNDDIAERMVGDGWAEADARAGLTLKALEAAARKAHRGMWRETIPEF